MPKGYLMLKHNDSVSFIATLDLMLDLMLDSTLSRIFDEQSLGLELIADEHTAVHIEM